MKKIPFALLLFLLTHALSAQQKSSAFQDLERQMQELQRQLLQEFQNNPFGGGLFAMPENDSSYTFRFDTTITGDNFSGFFHFGPFSGDSSQMSDPSGFEWLRNQLFGDGQMGDFWGQSDREENQEETAPEGEHLLPEERLRLEEKGQEPTEKGAPEKPAKAPKPKIKSIRI